VQLLAGLLDEGATLPQAVDQVPGLFLREATAIIRTGWATGTLPDALRQAAQIRSRERNTWNDLSSRLAYLLTLLIAFQFIFAFLCYFIAPKMEAIFMDFGIPLPGPTQVTIMAGHFWTGPVLLVVIPILLLEVFVLAMLPFGSVNLFQWEIPLIDRLFHRRHSALVFRSLALSIQGDRPISEALSVMAKEYPSRWVRARLQGALIAVNQGGDWVRALLTEGLIRQADAALLLSAQRVGNLDWALNEAAASADRRAGYRLQMFLEAFFPLVVVMMGLLVFLVAVGYFLPLITLIERLAG
jgi:protein transport protein HofC